MNGQQNGIYDLLRALEESLDKGFPLLSNYMVVVKREVVESLLDRIYASLPTEVQDARSLLRRRDEIQHEAQQRAEKIVADARARDVLGNGIQLIPVCRFLASGSGGIKALQGRAENPEVLYVNHECIVFAQKSEKFAFKPGIEFNLKLYFPVELKTAGMFREVFTECCVQSVYSDDKNEKTCAVCSFVSMKEEDIRFVYEMTTKNLFI